jgi:hypothetical protein
MVKPHCEGSGQIGSCQFRSGSVRPDWIMVSHVWELCVALRVFKASGFVSQFGDVSACGDKVGNNEKRKRKIKV